MDYANAPAILCGKAGGKGQENEQPYLIMGFYHF
jgi:hypothetical protein